jgi:AcrR family transcriptional regulator
LIRFWNSGSDEMTVTVPVADSPRRPQRANGMARYQHLLDAAEALLARDGSGALTIQALAREAGVPMASVYHYFPSAPAVSVALSERYMAGFHELAAQPIEGFEAMTWEEVVTILVQRGVAFYRAHPYAQTLVLGSDHSWHIRRADLDNNRAMVAGIATLITDKLPPIPPEPLAEAVFIGIGLADAVFSLSIAEHGHITDAYAEEAATAICGYMARKVEMLKSTVT